MRAFLCLFTVSMGVSAGARQFSSPAEHDSIAYTESTPTDSVATLQGALDTGAQTLSYDDEKGFLPTLLTALDIPVSSQTLVFSRTSLQVDRIAPWTPRAIYFNDDVYVGWVQGGPVIEIASVDPKLGAVFYTLPQDASSPPAFERQTSTCLMCHDSASITGGVPGFVVRSVLPDRYGYTISTVSDRPTTDRTPWEERWGGWYVTGTHGEQRHAGNAFSPLLTHEVGNVSHYARSFDLTTDGNVTDLSERFNTGAYLSPHSDVVALLVLAHQAFVHNLITKAGYEARRALHEERAFGEPDASLSALTLARIERAAEPLVQAMLFAKEVPLSAPVEGTSSFAADFVARGPKDAKGRSLRDLDLETRLFRYPMSFLVYSESFDALPRETRDYVYRRVREELTGTGDTNRAILEILTETKPEFASP